jgi:hypothetical protein
VPYVMRYLGQFPSEAQVRDVVIIEVSLIYTLRFKKTNHQILLSIQNSNHTC